MQDVSALDISSHESGGKTRLRKRISRTAIQRAGSDSLKDSTAMSIPQTLEAVEADFGQILNSGNEAKQYFTKRDDIVKSERESAWDAIATSSATPTELKAQDIIFRIREHERKNLFGDLPSEDVPQQGTRDMGGKFLLNLDKIHQSRIFKIARRMPKGCHLHIHFNSEIPPEKLFPIARTIPKTMFIRSKIPLSDRQAFTATEIVFNVLPETTATQNIFSDTYNPEWKNTTNSPWMRWSDFREHFPKDIECQDDPDLFELDRAEGWAREKMIITRHHAYREDQTHNGAWACFNQGTRAFKGLLNYESVYRWYIGHAIDSMIEDEVMYAELRPMLLDKYIPTDDGIGQLNHRAQMEIICEEAAKKKSELESQGKLDKFPFGLKIIYCTPRSIPRERMKSELSDCLKLKLQFPELICGFDLVGAEDRPNNIKYYADLLDAFAKACRHRGIEIPFMFHAGETLLDTGGSSNPDNSNLYDSLLLNAKRIGHGYSLLKHPKLLQDYKKQNICLELCPISNELLHLCGNAREHPYPELLAAGLHCTLNADNPSLFSSNLSQEFYQVMAGDPRMTVHGWKQLAQWSIEHSCLTPAQIEEAQKIHARAWTEFCDWVVAKHGPHADRLPDADLS